MPLRAGAPANESPDDLDEAGAAPQVNAPAGVDAAAAVDASNAVDAAALPATQVDFVYLKAALFSGEQRPLADLTLDYVGGSIAEVVKGFEKQAATYAPLIRENDRARIQRAFDVLTRAIQMNAAGEVTAGNLKSFVDRNFFEVDHSLCVLLEDYHHDDESKRDIIKLRMAIRDYSTSVYEQLAPSELQVYHAELQPNLSETSIAKGPRAITAASENYTLGPNWFGLRGMLDDVKKNGTPAEASVVRKLAETVLHAIKHDFASHGGLQAVDLPLIAGGEFIDLYRAAANNPDLRTVGVVFPVDEPGFVMDLRAFENLATSVNKGESLIFLVDCDTPDQASGTIVLPKGLRAEVRTRDGTEMPNVSVEQEDAEGVVRRRAVNAPQHTPFAQPQHA